MWMVSSCTSSTLSGIQPHVSGTVRGLSCSETSLWDWIILLFIYFSKESSESKEITISFTQLTSFWVDSLSNKISYVLRLVFIFKQISHYNRQWDITTWWSEIPCPEPFVLMWIRTNDLGVSGAVTESQSTEKRMFCLSAFVWTSDSHRIFAVLHTSPSLIHIFLVSLHMSLVVT